MNFHKIFIILTLLSSTYSTMTRTYDIVVCGATGFTGQLVVKYLATNYPIKSGLKWAIAGRRADALEFVKRTMAPGQLIDVLVYDIADKASLDAITSTAGCIITTAGPYDLVGIPLLESCVKNGANYCDITGEVQFVKKAINAYHDAALQKGLKIVNCCGFDCIPADIGCDMIMEELLSHGGTPVEGRMNVVVMKGGVSGGTIASAINMISSASSELIRNMQNPYFLCSEAPGDGKLARRNKDFGWYDVDAVEGYPCIPHVMEAVDNRIIHRSNELKGWRYGKGLLWGERMKTGSLSAARSVAFISLLVKPVLMILLRYVPFLIKPLLPKQGQGPTNLDGGCMRMRYWVRGDKDGKEVLVKGGLNALHGDPGYKLTAQMIVECALCTVYDKAHLPKTAGVLTPSVAYGAVIRNRLKERGFDFYIER
jgi:short subunit dehydrogenase-like uncharacterized protein